MLFGSLVSRQIVSSTMPVSLKSSYERAGPHVRLSSVVFWVWLYLAVIVGLYQKRMEEILRTDPPKHLAYRYSQPLTVVTSSFHMTSIFDSNANLAPASCGSALSRSASTTKRGPDGRATCVRKSGMSAPCRPMASWAASDRLRMAAIMA